METADQEERLIGKTMNAEANKLISTFGLYRAEWMNGELFSLFAEPSYFGALTERKPIVLIGGRGTGKTTVLRGLSYEGQYALTHATAASIREWGYYGLYFRVDTNHVTAFRGAELSEEKWTKVFAHFLNLRFCSLLLDFVEWFERTTQLQVSVSQAALRQVCASLNVDLTDNLQQLGDQLDLLSAKFEAQVNNVGDTMPSNLSMQKVPLDYLTAALAATEAFAGKQFFFLIDEYENLLDYQQRVMNTLIKHASTHYTFKVGVRELGWRVRETTNSHESLRHQADYERIDIVKEMRGGRFRQFAQRVCTGRLRASLGEIKDSPFYAMSTALPALSATDEAERLGVDEDNRRFINSLTGAPPELLKQLRGMPPLLVHTLKAWSKAQDKPVEIFLKETLKNQGQLKNRYNNYAHASLYSIRQGKIGIRKYYAGWKTFLKLANCNIRYLLELVHQSFYDHCQANPNSSLEHAVSHETQTLAAQKVGRKNLDDLEGFLDGHKLTKLLLGLGRVWQIFAASPEGHAPEVNQFMVVKDPAEQEQGRIEVDQLLVSAIMHSALVRNEGTKPAQEKDTREFDYSIHPIFAPFFVFSYRKKRKMPLTGIQLLRLMDDPPRAIDEILARRKDSETPGIPEQLLLFESFYKSEQ